MNDPSRLHSDFYFFQLCQCIFNECWEDYFWSSSSTFYSFMFWKIFLHWLLYECNSMDYELYMYWRDECCTQSKRWSIWHTVDWHFRKRFHAERDLFVFIRQSFPSGHSSTAFCGLIFLAVSFLASMSWIFTLMYSSFIFTRLGVIETLVFFHML